MFLPTPPVGPLFIDKQRRKKRRTYPTASVHGGSDRAVTEVDEVGNVVDVLIGSVGEHGAAAGEVEPVAVVADPVLDGLLHRELAVGHVGVPRHVAARRPGEGVPVAVRRGDTAFQNLVVLRTVSLAVDHSSARVLEGARVVLAGGVLAERHVARREMEGGRS